MQSEPMSFELPFWRENMVDVFILLGGFADGSGRAVTRNSYNHAVAPELFSRQLNYFFCKAYEE